MGRSKSCKFFQSLWLLKDVKLNYVQAPLAAGGGGLFNFRLRIDKAY